MGCVMENAVEKINIKLNVESFAQMMRPEEDLIAAAESQKKTEAIMEFLLIA